MPQRNWLSGLALGGWVVACILLAFNFSLVVAGAKYPCSEHANSETQRTSGDKNKPAQTGIGEATQQQVGDPFTNPTAANPKIPMRQIFANSGAWQVPLRTPAAWREFSFG